MAIFAQIINLLAELITLLVFVNVILSYILAPYHPIKQSLDRLLEPMLAPIRRLLPQTGMFDFSPIVLVLVVQLLARLLIGLIGAY